MCDSLGGSGEADIIPEAHKKKALKGHSLSFCGSLLLSVFSFKLSFPWWERRLSKRKFRVSIAVFFPVICTFSPSPPRLSYGVCYKTMSWRFSEVRDWDWHLPVFHFCLINSSIAGGFVTAAAGVALYIEKRCSLQGCDVATWVTQ